MLDGVFRRLFDRRSVRNIEEIMKIARLLGISVDENALWERSGEELERIKVLLLVAAKKGRSVSEEDVLNPDVLERKVLG